jgi:hypothetical protein
MRWNRRKTMKARHGFVSNSSSSSFILENIDMEELANSMLDTIIEDWEEWEDSQSLAKEWKKKLPEAVQYAKANGVGIMFPSCNYDTHIIEKDGKLLVSTCNNHLWDIQAKNLDYEGGEDYETVEEAVDSADFYDLRNGEVHSKEKYDDDKPFDADRKCPSCKATIWSYVIYKGKKVCPTCLNATIDGEVLVKSSFLILPVRGHEMSETEAIVKGLEDEGYKVHWPPRDTDQVDDTGLRICNDNADAIRKADVVHIIWDGKSQGGLFDLGVAFALKKKIIAISLPEATEGKSFQNMIRAWEKQLDE